MPDRIWVRALDKPFSGAYPRGRSGDAAEHPGILSMPNRRQNLTEISQTEYDRWNSVLLTRGDVSTNTLWCQANPTQCNMYNNVSYRHNVVAETGSLVSFSLGFQ